MTTRKTWRRTRVRRHGPAGRARGNQNLLKARARAARASSSLDRRYPDRSGNPPLGQHRAQARSDRPPLGDGGAVLQVGLVGQRGRVERVGGRDFVKLPVAHQSLAGRVVHEVGRRDDAARGRGPRGRAAGGGATRSGTRRWPAWRGAASCTPTAPSPTARGRTRAVRCSGSSFSTAWDKTAIPVNTGIRKTRP